MDRVVVNRSFTLSKTFSEGGVATDPDSPPVVTVTRSTGEAVVAGGVIDEATTGTWSVTVPASSNDRLDTLTVDWAAIVNAVEQEYVDLVEVAGDQLFTILQARTLDPLGDDTTYTAERIAEARTLAEQAIENACGVAFVPRYRLRSFPATRELTLRLWDPHVSLIRSVSIGGTELADVDALVIDGEYVTHTLSWYPAPVVIGYEHGLPFAPGEVSRAALLLARWYLIDSPMDERWTSVSTEVGTFTLTTPGMRGAHTALPEVNAVIQNFRTPTVA